MSQWLEHISNLSGSFSARLTPEAIAMFRVLLGELPNSCPSCDWTHPSDLWRLVGNSWECMNCGNDLEWPSLIG